MKDFCLLRIILCGKLAKNIYIYSLLCSRRHIYHGKWKCGKLVCKVHKFISYTLHQGVCEVLKTLQIIHHTQKRLNMCDWIGKTIISQDLLAVKIKMFINSYKKSTSDYFPWDWVHGKFFLKKGSIVVTKSILSNHAID